MVSFHSRPELFTCFKKNKTQEIHHQKQKPLIYPMKNIKHLTYLVEFGVIEDYKSFNETFLILKWNEKDHLLSKQLLK